ncbi:MAG: type II toxin-antitoxin system RelB/DinJ family antitoxin [candidate division KSB1 bacterium]|nr:type II toxin-antitoxin system RelB/DinJ family antitoxin [candidate division KSB1 bacterium]
MAKTAIIQARIEPEVKNNAQNIPSKLNITMSEAISIFLTQVTLNRGIPFDVKIPNDLTFDTLLKSENEKEVHKVSSVDELFELDS